MSSTKSFSSLLAADLRPTTTTTTTRGLGDRIAERTGSGVPKFKSLPPLSFPISPSSLVSPSSYFSIPYGLSPNELLDSPVLLSASTILPSPTTGTFPLQAFNWQSNSSVSLQNINNEKNNLSDFSFQPQTKPPQFCKTVDQTWDYHQTVNQEGVESDEPNLKSDFNSIQSFSPEIATIQTDHQTNNTIQSEYNQSLQNSKSGDGYNWRKYGQKQVKGSENPRSYYKCTHPNCPIKKKVEMSLAGQITEIVYRGSHNHPKPQSTRRSSSASSAVIQSHQTRSNDISDYYGGSNGMGKIDSSVATPENSSITVGDDDFEQSSHGGRLIADDIDENEPDAKRWKGESEGISAVAALGRTVREPRVVVQTRSDIDILIDGYRWRKYGQKVVRGNPNPRSYYKCTNPGCPVRKHVERASHDTGAVITTYEGKHNHDIPPARGSTSNNQSLTRPVPTNPDYYTSIAMSLPHHNPNHQTPPYTLEMLHSPESFGYSIAKNEPTSHMFSDSFLY